MAANLYKERRYSSRVKLRVPLHYQLQGDSEFGNTLTEDVSLGGIGFVNNKFLASGVRILLEFNILSRLLKAIGKIVWSSPLPHSDRYRVGIQFQELDPIVSRDLSDYIDMQTGNPRERNSL